VKRRDLLKQLRSIAKATDTDFRLLRQGANHELWTIMNQRLVIPRHREINEHTARSIIKLAKETVNGT